MFRKTHGFTLIELLVVIAIIAILAAILFPVFAQAKVAAKGAASISNSKQIGLSLIMYSNDVDDVSPMDCVWGARDAYYWYGTPGSEFSPWSYELMPYMKNGDVEQDPLTSKETVGAGTPSYIAYSYDPQYGLNYTALSPITDTSTTPWKRSPVTLSSLSKPSETVAITSRPTNSEEKGYWYGPGTIVNNWTVEAPDCNDIAPICLTNWGKGWWSTNALKDNVVAGANTGFVSLRKANSAVVAFADGHTKIMAAGQLAAGTNWSPTISADALRMVDSSKYLWGNF